MNQFVVSARKYRPATFDTVVGQSHITNTLKNAIRNNHLAQAFLFCGPRGVGKTTCARILAKALNCSNLSENIEPCNECESCKSFNSGQSLNIYELDAASNNSVEDIRSLVEQVRYAPHSGEFKIYIIDEVHMLSAGAFNAFLKTLEEPPSYAVFILATTEKHKIIPTILSRCQIFDFNRIMVDDITKHLEFVAASENIKAEVDALHIIAQKSEGALRDALSMFDQIVSFAGTNVTYKDAINNLNVLDYDYYFRVTDDVSNGNYSSVLLTFNELLSDGFDGHQFINGLGSHFRDLLVCQDASTLPLLEVSKSISERYKSQAEQTPPALLLQYLEICSKCDLEYRAAKNQRLHVELALIKMCGLSGELPSAPAIQKKSTERKTEPLAKTVAKETPVSSPVTKSEVPTPVAAKPTVTPVAKSATTAGTTVKPGGFLKGTSIAAAMQKSTAKEEESEYSTPENLSKNPVDNDSLQKVWMEYATMQQEKGKRQLYTTLSMDKPTMLDDITIELVIHNQSQNNLLQEEKSALMDHLRSKLSNYYLQLQTKIEERNTDNDAYTTMDRYKKMVEKNPDLDELRKQLGLELDQ